jgi:NitT/TauT family transport system ATP-binding protein
MVFQDPMTSLDPTYTIGRQIGEAVRVHNKNAGADEIKRRAVELMDLVGIDRAEERYEARPWMLSGGMRQRVALIRTLVLEPEILLLDEPFSALDFQTRLGVCDDVSKIISEEQKTAILVTHDLSEAISMADRVVVLTKKPAKIKKIFDINLKDYGPPLKRRESPEFAKLFDKIWKEITTDEK